MNERLEDALSDAVLAAELKTGRHFDFDTVYEVVKYSVRKLEVIGNLIAGNQRHKVVSKKFGPDTELDCKRLIGYTKSELRAINIKDNTHSGEWDLDLLADWTADLTVDLGLDKPDEDAEQRTIPDMELIHYEKYDYVLIACRNELDYNDLVRKLGIEGQKVKIAKTRKIKGRAIWYDQLKAQLVEKESAE